MIDLSVKIEGVKFQNPVMPASGTYEVLDSAVNKIPSKELGALINKTVFLDTRLGNPPPRICETPCGLINSIGIPSAGVYDFIDHQLPKLSKIGPPVLVSIAGNTIEEFCNVAELIESTGKADFLELDLSCPNIHAGTQWASSQENLEQVIIEVKGAVKLPIIAKLSPMVSDIGEMALSAQMAGAAAVAMVNTFRAMAIDINEKKPVLGNITGGLSGPAIRPIAVSAVYSSYQKIDIPIIGMGGITGWQDAVEFLLAGASLVAVGMYNFVNPFVMKEIISGIENYLIDNNFSSVNEIIGLAHKND